MLDSGSLIHLGASLNSDGKVRGELGRRIGRAWGEFSKLVRLWRHTSLSVKRKTEIFQAVVTTQLLYGLSTVWLSVAELRRLNGFQARCLRVLLRIQPAFVSRVSNQLVLERASQLPYTKQLMKQQLNLFGRVARAPDTDVLRRLTFTSGTLQPAANRFIRRVGRPRHEWTSMLKKAALGVAGSEAELTHLITQPLAWKKAVDTYCR